MNKGVNVLSLFDGMSCGQIALERAGIEVGKYYASEIDKYAMTVANKNFPDTIQLGDVTKWRDWDIDWASIDLLLAGFPCQAFSVSGKRKGFDDPRGKLAFVLLEIKEHIQHINPNLKFLLENVKMKKDTVDTLSSMFGVESVGINSSLVSAQNRDRLYWCNWSVSQPDDKGIVLSDIIENGVVDRLKSYCLDANYAKGGNLTQYFNKSRRQLVFQVAHGCNKGGFKAINGEVPSLTTSSWQYNNFLASVEGYRMLTVTECERLQTVPQYIKTVELVLCLDLAKNFVDAVEKNPKLQKLVLSAENKELKEYAILVNQNMNANQVSTKNTALQDVDMQTQAQTKRCTIANQGVSSSTASTAENITTCKQVESEVGSAIQPAFITITEGKITHHGKEELPQKEKVYTVKVNGKIVLKLSGKEMMQNASDALSALEMVQTSQNFTSITSFRLSTKNLEQILTISYWFAKSATGGSTQDTTQEKTLYLTLIDGYTEGVSNTQRYKMLGNGWTVDIISHILSQSPLMEI